MDKKSNWTFWPKLIGWAVLTHIILITISFIEVFIYSIIINPGQEESVYNEHAARSAPYIAVIFGVFLFFFLVRFLVKKQPHKRMLIALSLPILYIIIDLMILIPMGIDWEKHYLVFILSFGDQALVCNCRSFCC